MTDVTISALYSTYENAKQAVHDLEKAHVDTENISIIASNGEKKYDSYGKEVAEDSGKGAGIGAAVGGATGLLASLGLLAIPGVGPVVAAGWLSATAAGALTGAAVGAATGGLIGALTESGLSEEDANLYAEHVRRGGALVVVRVDDDEDADDVHAILTRHQTMDPATTRSFYTQQGWQRFDPSSEPFTAEQIATERNRWSSYKS